MNETEWWRNGLRRAADSNFFPRLPDPQAALAGAIGEAVNALEPVWELRVVCTDKGQHPSTVLGVIARSDGSDSYEFGAALPKGLDHLGRLNLDAKHGEVVEHRERVHGDLIRWWCPRCHRDEPWNWERAQGIAKGLERAQVSRLDISAIPS